MGHFRKQNKCNFTSKIGSVKTAIKEEQNKMSAEFILKKCKLFQRWIDTENNWKKMAAILCKFTVSCLSSYFVVYFLKLKFIFFDNTAVYYYTRIFLILISYPVHCYKTFLLYFKLFRNSSISSSAHKDELMGVSVDNSVLLIMNKLLWRGVLQPFLEIHLLS